MATTASDVWYHCELGDGLVAPGPAAEIESRFWPAFEAAGRPALMAVFTRLESEGRLHCEVVAFFSPAAAEVARLSGATPCTRPASQGLSLLAGDPAGWATLFSDP
mgnify:CR=1 FL=1